MVERGTPRGSVAPARPSMHRKFRHLMDDTGMVDDLMNDDSDQRCWIWLEA